MTTTTTTHTENLNRPPTLRSTSTSTSTKLRWMYREREKKRRAHYNRGNTYKTTTLFLFRYSLEMKWDCLVKMLNKNWNASQETTHIEFGVFTKTHAHILFSRSSSWKIEFTGKMVNDQLQNNKRINAPEKKQLRLKCICFQFLLEICFTSLTNSISRRFVRSFGIVVSGLCECFFFSFFVYLALSPSLSLAAIIQWWIRVYILCVHATCVRVCISSRVLSFFHTLYLLLMLLCFFFLIAVH